MEITIKLYWALAVSLLIRWLHKIYFCKLVLTNCYIILHNIIFQINLINSSVILLIKINRQCLLSNSIIRILFFSILNITMEKCYLTYFIK